MQVIYFLYLLVAICFEIIGTTFLKLSQGFTQLVPSILTVVFYALSFGFMSLTLKKIDVGVAYAIWSGLGIALIATIGVLWFKEPMTIVKLSSMVLFVLGVMGLNLSGRLH